MRASCSSRGRSCDCADGRKLWRDVTMTAMVGVYRPDVANDSGDLLYPVGHRGVI
ncbi:hypothetical protein GCM10009599_17240 [Luteococcus peritonei]